MSMPVPAPLKRFIWDIQSMVELADDPREILLVGRDLMARLVAADDWLPAAFAAAGAEGPRQYQLYGDAMQRFCVVCTVLADGQGLPVFAQTHWEIVGGLRGQAERRRIRPGTGAADARAPAGLGPGTAIAAPPDAEDGVRLINRGPTGTAVLIHVHGMDIGAAARPRIGPDGRRTEAVADFSNPPDWPPYDILTIQTRIID